MPWVRRGRKVYKKSGELVGVSKSVEMAKKHLKALYASEGRKKKKR